MKQEIYNSVSNDAYISITRFWVWRGNTKDTWPYCILNITFLDLAKVLKVEKYGQRWKASGLLKENLEKLTFIVSGTDGIREGIFRYTRTYADVRIYKLQVLYDSQAIAVTPCPKIEIHITCVPN